MGLLFPSRKACHKAKSARLGSPGHSFRIAPRRGVRRQGYRPAGRHGTKSFYKALPW